MARRSEISSVSLIADSLRASYGNVVPLPSDGALAVYATKLLPHMALPFPLRAVGVGETELREEYEDAVEYTKSADGRRAIEEKRVLLLGSTARGLRITLAGYVLERSRDFREAYSLTRRLRIRFLPATTSLDLVDVVDQLEAALSNRRSVLQEAAAKPGATASSIVTALLDEINRIESSAPAGPSRPTPADTLPPALPRAATGRIENQ